MKSTSSSPRWGTAIGGGLLVGWLLLPAVAAAQFVYVTGTTLDLAGGVVTPRDVVTDLSGAITTQSLVGLPPTAAISGVHQDAGATLFAIRASLELPGGVFLERRDVGSETGGVYSVVFDGDAAGLPANAAIDGVSRDDAGDLLVSFATTTDVGGLVVDDADVLSWDGSSFSLFFDASAAAVPTGLDVDGVHYEAAGDALLLSFDGGAQLAGLDFGREDILRYDRAGGTWTLALDATTTEPALATSNLVAVPEPGLLPALAAGLLALAGRASARSRMPR